MDILSPLPETSNHNKYLLIVGDYFSKWTKAYPIKDMEAQTVGRILTNEFITRYRVPEILHTDQSGNFESILIKELCQILGITKTRTTPYHPQSDGMIERFNRTLLWVQFPATSRQQSCKLHCPCQGPFKVVKVINDVTFRVQRTNHPWKRLVVHFNRLKPYMHVGRGVQENSEKLPEIPLDGD